MNAYILKKQNPKKFEITDLILKRAKRTGFVEIYPNEPTKWNYHKSPREGGSGFDVEGHSSSDVYGIWDVRWWQPRYWYTVKSSIIQYLEDVREFVLKDFKLWLAKDPKYLFRQIRDWLFVNPLKIEREGWVWVVDALSTSMKMAAYKLAEDLLAQEEGFKDAIDKFYKQTETFDHEKIQALADKLMSSEEGQNQVFSYMITKGRLVRVSSYMWAYEHDPMCFVIDDKFIPFDMKDGWSQDMLVRIIAYWFRVFYGADLTVKIKNK